MAYQCKVESGLQIFAKSNIRPGLNGLNDILFPDGPNIGDVIEISGNSSSGKTLLLTQFLTKCILPKEHRGVVLGGLCAGVILIDTDHHFQILKLVQMMEEYLKKYWKKLHQSGTDDGQVSLGGSDIETVIKESLKRLIIHNCYNSTQLGITFHTLNKTLISNTNVSLVILDSASAYYWQDAKCGGIRKMDLYLKNIVTTLQRCNNDFKVTIMYTKPSNFQSKVHKIQPVSKPGPGNITHRIELHRIEHKDQDDSFCANISSVKLNKQLRYFITSQGLNWILEA